MPRLDQSIRIVAPIDQAYQFWRDFRRLPAIFSAVEAVDLIDPGGRRSRWALRGPAGRTFTIDAELTQDQPPNIFSWRSVGGDLGLSGGVAFTPIEGETLVHVIVDWSDAPGGAIGAWLAQASGLPDRAVRTALAEFKQHVEDCLARGERQPPPPPGWPESHSAISSS